MLSLISGTTVCGFLGLTWLTIGLAEMPQSDKGIFYGMETADPDLFRVDLQVAIVVDRETAFSHPRVFETAGGGSWPDGILHGLFGIIQLGF